MRRAIYPAISAVFILAMVTASSHADELVPGEGGAAGAEIGSTTDSLTGKEMEVGRYNLQKKNFIGAINRFKIAANQYPTSRFAAEALFHLTYVYLVLGIDQEAQAMGGALHRHFPDSPWYAAAEKVLRLRGLDFRTTNVLR